jgi:hypothetical protein
MLKKLMLIGQATIGIIGIIGAGAGICVLFGLSYTN